MNKHYLKLYTYLAPSKVCDGVGVFALTEIPKDTLIWRIFPKEYHKYKWEEIPNEYEDYVTNMTFCDEEGFKIDCDLDRLYGAYYVNHSENPNVRIGKHDEYISTRIIYKDEEILYNYPPKDKIWQ